MSELLAQLTPPFLFAALLVGGFGWLLWHFGRAAKPWCQDLITAHIGLMNEMREIMPSLLEMAEDSAQQLARLAQLQEQSFKQACPYCPHSSPGEDGP